MTQHKKNAFFRFEVGTLSRSTTQKLGKGKEVKVLPKTPQFACQYVAYCTGTRIHEERRDMAFNYTAVRDRVVKDVLLIPDGAPAWMQDGQSDDLATRQAVRARIWNAMASRSKREDFREARIFVISLPREMTHAQGIACACEFVQTEVIDKQRSVADISFHAGLAADGGENFHAHVIMTPYPVDDQPDGFNKQKNRILDKDKWLTAMREQCADTINHHLDVCGIDKKVDHRSLASRGEPRQPEHLPTEALHLERKGTQTHLGDAWRGVRHHNKVVELHKRDSVKEGIEEEHAQLTAAQARTRSLLALAREVTGRHG